MSRARIRIGRAVSYNPTVAEVTASGDGPWPALITDVDPDGRVDLLVHTPGDNLGAGIDPVPAVVEAAPTTPSGVGYVQAESTALADAVIELQIISGIMRQHLLDTRKNAVTRGGGPGQYDFFGEGAD